jgi:flagellar basal-body rod protein FlgB
MIGSLFQSTTIPVMEQVLAFTQARHEVLAGNIANADVPSYQTRDLSVEQFQKMLGDALTSEPSHGVQSLGYEGTANLDVRSAMRRDQKLREVGDSLPSILRHDGNNVGLEEQVREMSKNQMMHSLAISILNSQFRMLQLAVNERV